jgi:deoxyribonuclease-4
MKKHHTLLFGAHMSIAGKIYESIERGESINCTAIQIFTKSNRQWYAKPLQEEDVQTFKDAWKKSSIESIVVHASYLLNIGSTNHESEKKSLEALEIEFKRCSDLGVPYLVLHPGSYTSGDEQECIKKISRNLDHVLSNNPEGMVLLETMAGQGSQIGYTFEQLAQIIKLAKHKRRIGVCFDTCHAFAAGYDFTTEKTYKEMWKHFDKTIGIHKLKAMHINDSHKDLGSRVDRHADIGKGKIGLEAFELIFNDPALFDVPKILETPRTELSDYRKNMDLLEKLLNKKTRSQLRVT